MVGAYCRVTLVQIGQLVTTLLDLKRMPVALKYNVSFTLLVAVVQQQFHDFVSVL